MASVVWSGHLGRDADSVTDLTHQPFPAKEDSPSHRNTLTKVDTVCPHLSRDQRSFLPLNPSPDCKSSGTEAFPLIAESLSVPIHQPSTSTYNPTNSPEQGPQCSLAPLCSAMDSSELQIPIQATDGESLASTASAKANSSHSPMSDSDTTDSPRGSGPGGIIPCSLHIAELDTQVTEDILIQHFSQESSLVVVSARIVRHKFTGLSQGYGYVQFSTEAQTVAALDRFNFGKILGRVVRLSLAKERAAVQRQQRNNKANLYVKNLDPSIDSHQLYQLFKHYGPITSVRVMESINGRSRGFGFVCYEDEMDAIKALESQGKLVCGKHLQVSIANTPTATGPSSRSTSRTDLTSSVIVSPHSSILIGTNPLPEYYTHPSLSPVTQIPSPLPHSTAIPPMLYWGTTYVPVVIPPDVMEKYGGDPQAAMAAGQYSVAMGYPMGVTPVSPSLYVFPNAALSTSLSTLQVTNHSSLANTETSSSGISSAGKASSDP